MKTSCKLAAITGLFLQMASPVGADENVKAGLALAQTMCSECHAISPDMIGRHPLAPTFQDIANRYSVWNLEEAFAEGILVGHASMPKFVLEPKEINDLLSYMDTLSKSKKPSQ